MAFRKVLSITLFLSVSLAAPAPQTTILQAAAAQPTFLSAIGPNSFAPVAVRTVVAQPAVHAVQPAAVQVVRAVPADTGAYEYASDEQYKNVADPHPQYSFGYSVADTRSGDSKTREESRDGDVVTGSYSVADPDGRIRRVDYTADKEHGFQATVTYDGETGPVAIPIDAPVKTVTTDTAFITSAAAEPVVSSAAAAQTQQEVTVIDARDNIKKNEATVVRTVPAVQTVQAFSPALQTVQVVRAAPQPLIHAAPQQIVRLSNGQAISASPFGLQAFPVDNGFLSGFQTLPAGARFVHV